MSMISPGANLALLLLGGFRQLASATDAELSRRGFPGITPANEFAMRAIAAGAGDASELARRLSVSKQAAAKTIAALEQRGYVTRAPDPGDARRKRLSVTPRGFQSMRVGEEIMEDLRRGWEQQIGKKALRKLEASLVLLVGPSPINLDAPGSIDGDIGPSDK
jgi:DNA-binding MarR family transcriptional regulator